MLDLGWCGGPLRGQGDRLDGGGLRSPRRAARLHGPRGVDGERPPLAQRAERPDPGDGAGLLHRLVHGARLRPAGRRERDGAPRLEPPGAGRGAAARPHRAAGRHGPPVRYRPRDDRDVRVRVLRRGERGPRRPERRPAPDLHRGLRGLLPPQPHHAGHRRRRRAWSSRSSRSTRRERDRRERDRPGAGERDHRPRHARLRTRRPEREQGRDEGRSPGRPGRDRGARATRPGAPPRVSSPAASTPTAASW